jgi:hypothetical protein
MNDTSNQNEDALDWALGMWRVEKRLPLGFESQVWRRISASTEARAGLWPVLQDWFEMAFSRPAVAVAYAVVLLFIGSGMGYWQAREKSAMIEQSLGSRYVHSVDPYQKTSL